MFRLLLTRRWLAWLAVAAVWATACLFLGRWQWHRFESRHAAQQLIRTNYDAPAVPLSSVVAPGAPLPRNTVWRQVRLSGQYDTGSRVLIRNRPNSGNYGYELVVPFVLTNGGRVLVDRGWLPNGPNANAPDKVPATPAGALTVVGWVRAGEPSLRKPVVPGQAASINLPELSAQVGGSAYNAYVLVRSERAATGAAIERATLLPPPDLGTSAWINFSYALQWWLGIVAGFGFVLARARREHLDATGRAKAPKERKVRIWDEEDA
ncbi:SURF1 family protein [Calidifontibacter sp. DB0510]|uniref:SURF1-like protein n=1 Tax=Metallococcus carri TaxID=1656884 RepID=A0A967B099_9MICO|nr:SURF1 family protein [Metallococcus carri]NHN54880.1 SURF1 family protein [Metallococcus carri]NOP37225.1 SURF1 family protein [Calidifontibacter sp. DB2511S]